VETAVQVWCRPLPLLQQHGSAAAPLLSPPPPLYSGVAAVPAATDALLGCASLDLSALQLLGLLEGWYTIADVAGGSGRSRGQLKVCFRGGGWLLAPAVASASMCRQRNHVSCGRVIHDALSHVCKQVSLTPLSRVDGRPHQQLCSSSDSLAQVLASWPAATAAVKGGSAALGGLAADSGNPEMLRLSDAAFLALAEQSTAAAEAALSAVEEGGGGGGGLRAGDGPLDALRANLQVRVRSNARQLLPWSKAVSWGFAEKEC
jgi:hypothetical protein